MGCGICRIMGMVSLRRRSRKGPNEVQEQRAIVGQALR
jgi:hypothetical protein